MVYISHIGNNQPTPPMTTLNAGQQSFYDKVVSLNFQQLLLTGDAGCGKTYVLTQALAELFRQGFNVLLCAPTHKARVNLLEKMPEDVRPYIPTATVASILSRHGFNIGDGRIGFTTPKADRLGNWNVIAIDEVSMLSLADYETLKNSGVKILFTGDFAQLPTIMQKGSGMLDDETLERIHLTEQMRQQGVIHQVAEANRKEVYFPTESMRDDDSELVVHKTTEELYARMVSDILADPRGIEGHPNYCLITYTNDAVYEVGQMIRDMVIADTLGRDAITSPFAKGEYVMSYSNNAAAYNGEVAKVVDFSTDPLHRNTSSRPWDSYRVCIEGSRGTCWVNAVAPKDNVLIQDRIDELVKLVREAQKHKAFDAVAAYMEEIEHLRNYWVKFLYPFAITCHKSQGSTIEHVYVDTISFSKASSKRALLYVGLSRASKTLHTVIVPKPRWQVVREINDRYRNAKHAYEIAFGEPHWKLRIRIGLPARTAEDKAVLTEYIEMMLLDAAQDEAQESDDQLEAPSAPAIDIAPGYIMSGEGQPVEF